ncbi:MAG: AAA family ATPase, partial [Candidatus Jordarchaeum sp.]|uniref:AAA family ATPase n=1 Tax=Candidatus Jordarchaeum sp. TaxID=2823881 RepID=UPI00404AD6B7
MIEYDYKLERNEGDEIKVFVPNQKITKCLSDLVYIEGPNSSGKSTLLNIIALSLFGLDKKGLNPALKNKLDSLINSPHQKLKFNVKITNKNTGLKLESIKDDPNNPSITVYEVENGKKRRINKDKFETKYNLIYDIPNNPTDRLRELVNEIKNFQQTYGNKVGSLMVAIKNMISDIQKSRDQDKIDKYRHELEKANYELEKLEPLIKNIKEELNLLETYTYCRFYMEYAINYEYNALAVEEKKKQIKKIEKSVTTQDKKFDKLKQELMSTIYKMQEIFNEATQLLILIIPKEEKYLLKIWEKMDFYKSAEDFEFDPNLERLILKFRDIAIKLKNKIEKQDALSKAKLFQDLINILQNYYASNFIIPGVEKSVPDFIYILKQSMKEYEKILKESENLDRLKEALQFLDDKREYVEKFLFQDLNRVKEQRINWDQETCIYSDLEEKISKLEERLKEIETKLKDYFTKIQIKKIKEDEIKNILLNLKENETLKKYIPVYLEDDYHKKIDELQK